MTTPSFAQYRNTATTTNGLTNAGLKMRQLQCLAALASNQNPDGTVKGS